MTAYIYIHALSEIVEKFVVEISCLEDISEFYIEALSKYRDKEGFSFDVMIV